MKEKIELAILNVKTEKTGQETMEDIFNELIKRGIATEENINKEISQVKTNPDGLIFTIEEKGNGGYEVIYEGIGGLADSLLTITLNATPNTGIVGEVTISVEASSRIGITSYQDADGNVKTYENNTKSIEETYVATQNGTYTFKVIDSKGKEKEESIQISNILEGLISIIPSTTAYTTTGITVTIEWPEESDLGTKQISIDGGETWSTYTGPVDIESNCTIKAKLVIDENTVKSATLTISTIDANSPIVTAKEANVEIKEGVDNSLDTYFTIDNNGTAPISSIIYTDTSNSNENISTTSTLAQGTHVIKCKVTKANGLSAEAQVTIEVTESYPPGIDAISFTKVDNGLQISVEAHSFSGRVNNISFPLTEKPSYIGDLTTATGASYGFTNGTTGIESTNQGVNSSISDSYITIDLRNYSSDEKIDITVSATISSESFDRGCVYVTETPDVISSTTTNRIMQISGINSATKDQTLDGGKLYYLHFVYNKDGSTHRNDDKFTVTSMTIKLPSDEQLYYSYNVNNTGYIDNSTNASYIYETDDLSSSIPVEVTIRTASNKTDTASAIYQPISVEGDITITPSTTSWTNSLSVDITYPEGDYINEISIDNGRTWDTYAGYIYISQNCTIKARAKVLEEGTPNVVTELKSAALTITNIDNLKPNEFSASIVNTSTTDKADVVTIRGSTTDAAATEISGSSGVVEYYFSKDDGRTWQNNDNKLDSSYTFEIISPGAGEVVNLTIKAVDRVGNSTTATIPFTTTVGLLEGKGTESEPYLIQSIEDLVELSQIVNRGMKCAGKYFKLTKTLDFQDTNSYENASDTSYGDLNTVNGTQTIKEELTDISEGAIGFIPIGTNIEFYGNFLGNNYSINNIYINTTAYGGLIGKAYNSIISDLSVSGNIISTSSYIGGIVGSLGEGSEISNCHNSATLKYNGTSSYCNVGGIIGSNRADDIVIKDCYNTGTITGGKVGGIVGELSQASTIVIENCYNTGVINATSIGGGIIGYAIQSYPLTISKCYNAGAINSSGNAGGIIGEATQSNTSIINCYNNAAITGEDNVGGIIGEASQSDTSFTNCYNAGTITATTYAGGIVGYGIQSDLIFTNIYLLSGSASQAVGYSYSTAEGTCTVKTAAQMRVSSFTTTLNASQNPAVWKTSSTSQNSGYPRLSWEND